MWKVPGSGSKQSCSCWPTPQPQQHRIQATSATYFTAHSHVGCLTHRARPGMEPASSWRQVGFVTCWATVGTPGRYSFYPPPLQGGKWGSERWGQSTKLQPGKGRAGIWTQVYFLITRTYQRSQRKKSSIWSTNDWNHKSQYYSPHPTQLPKLHHRACSCKARWWVPSFESLLCPQHDPTG